MSESEELNPVLRDRREKLAQLGARGVPAFAYAYDRTHATDEAVAAFEALERVSPRSSLVPRARLDRADALNRLDRRADAVDLLRPIADDPQQPLSLAASEALGRPSASTNGRPRP